MANRTVLRMGDPLLLEKAQPIMQFNTPELHALINDMQDTMRAMDGDRKSTRLNSSHRR